jgi:hypothetical protein
VRYSKALKTSDFDLGFNEVIGALIGGMTCFPKRILLNIIRKFGEVSSSPSSNGPLTLAPAHSNTAHAAMATFVYSGAMDSKSHDYAGSLRTERLHQVRVALEPWFNELRLRVRLGCLG